MQQLADGWVVAGDHRADYHLVLCLWQRSEDGAVIDLQQTHTHPQTDTDLRQHMPREMKAEE